MTELDTARPTEQQLRFRIAELMPLARAELAELVAFPSVFLEPSEIGGPEQPAGPGGAAGPGSTAGPGRAAAADEPMTACELAAARVAAALADAGLPDVEMLPTPDGSTTVLARRPAPPGGRTVALYAHYDVQPPGDLASWQSPPFELTERDGRWFGRGAADCKGNLEVHLTALRALGGDLPVGVIVVVEGSEETGAGGLERLVAANPQLLAEADAVVVADSGNAALGVPTVTTALRGVVNLLVRVETMAGEMHSGTFGGPAPDALIALIQLIATLHDEAGDVTVTGLAAGGRWEGLPYQADDFRRDAGVLDGVELAGSGTVADQLWARPALTVLGIDGPPVAGSAAAVRPRAAARLNLRVPPGLDARDAEAALVAHLEAAVPRRARLTIEREGIGQPFQARTDGPAYRTLAAALSQAYGQPTTTVGQGGAIPLCATLATTYPDAEIMLIGVSEPGCLMHAPNESVHPSEIEHLALAEALFLLDYADVRSHIDADIET